MNVLQKSAMKAVSGWLVHDHDESERAGTVEVCQNGVWGPVCGDQWDIPDATAVCIDS